jgi:two-component system sensor histidine kinase/response regulator
MKPDYWINYLKQKWYKLRGNEEDFPLESQIYHSFSIIVILALLIMLPTNFLLGQYVSVALCVISIFLQIGAFYLSRYKGNTKLAILISCILSNLFLCANYFYNAGILGPTLMACSVTLFILMVVVSQEMIFFWFVVNLFLASLISFIEYHYPRSVTGYYEVRSYHFANIMTIYVIGIIVLFVGTTYIRHSYQKEKDSSAEKAFNLERLNNEKDKIFSIIAHDLKTPLASIQQFLNLLTHIEIDSNERKWIEGNLLKATTSTQELLENLLQWSKNQLEGTEMHISKINLKSNLKKALDMLNVVAQNKNIKLNATIADDIIVLADTDMLQLIIRNLLHNAIKFTRIGGMVDLIAKTDDRICTISITDNGVGMSETVQDEAFSLKIKSTYGTDNEKGTGLGLVLCKEYIELQSGKIWFSSQQDVGSVFNISLPLAILPN